MQDLSFALSQGIPREDRTMTLADLVALLTGSRDHLEADHDQ